MYVCMYVCMYVLAIYRTGTPTIVVVTNGRPLALLWVKENIDTIVEAWQGGTYAHSLIRSVYSWTHTLIQSYTHTYTLTLIHSYTTHTFIHALVYSYIHVCTGQAQGTAFAEMLFGVFSPAGRLPITLPQDVGQVWQRVLLLSYITCVPVNSYLLNVTLLLHNLMDSLCVCVASDVLQLQAFGKATNIYCHTFRSIMVVWLRSLVHHLQVLGSHHHSWIHIEEWRRESVIFDHQYRIYGWG